MHEILQRIQTGGLATLFTLAAGATLLLLSNANVIANSDHTLLYIVAGWILIVAAIGPLVPVLKPYAELLVWNATGWSIGLAVLGLDTVGAMPMWPIMLAALALTFWPRDPEQSLPVSAIAIVVIGGMLVCWLAWSRPQVPTLDTWLEGL